jgi:hypothetical protein
MKSFKTTLMLFLTLSVLSSVLLVGKITAWDWVIIGGIGTFVATFFMAIFAWLTYASAKESGDKQQELLQHQNKTQRKEYDLKLLKDMLDNVEDYRKFIIEIRKDIENQIFCNKIVSLDNYDSYVSSNWNIIKRVGILFDQKYYNCIESAFGSYRTVVYESQQIISEIGGSFPQATIKRDSLINNIGEQRFNYLKNKYEKIYDNFFEAKDVFHNILDELYKKIDKISDELKSNYEEE